MLSHAALPHVPTDGRTASGDPLNGPRYQLPTAQSWIGSRPRWTRGEIWGFRASPSSLEALFFRHRGRIDRPYGECQFNNLTFRRKLNATETHSYRRSGGSARDAGGRNGPRTRRRSSWRRPSWRRSSWRRSSWRLASWRLASWRLARSRSVLARRSLVGRLWRRPVLANDSCWMDLDLQLNAKRGAGCASSPSLPGLILEVRGTTLTTPSRFAATSHRFTYCAGTQCRLSRYCRSG